MKMLADPDRLLEDGLAAIRLEFQLPDSFPPNVLAAAETAAMRTPSEHVDRTERPFVTLDPATSTDLDQAFMIEPAGNDLLLHYAIADVAWFVRDGDAVDQEAWRRGTTQYLPDGKVSLYPPIISEHAASLLPDGPRPAIVFAVRVDPEGIATLDGAERAVIRSRAKLGYETVQEADLPASFAEFARRAGLAEDRRGAARIDVPEQEVERNAEGRFELRFRPRQPSEERNAALSLASNIAIAQALLAHHTGLFRTMAGPDDRAIERLRNTARAYGLTWPRGATLAQFQRMLDPDDARQAAFGQAVHRAGSGARYEPFEEGTLPWHAAVASPYAHATAPLRRLADRYVVQAAFAVANGREVPLAVRDAFVTLPKVMSRADALGGRIERAVVDLAEAAMLRGREGQVFPALVTDVDERGARVQLRDLPIVTRRDTTGMMPGTPLQLRLMDADVAGRLLRFDVVDADG